jgi:TniQ/Bacterial regulatory helix-turn-helix protein, lysR family
MNPPPSTTGGRILPIRVPVADDESIGSWLEAVARRNQLSVARLLAGMGMPATRAPHQLTCAAPASLLRELEQQAGLEPGRLTRATLIPLLLPPALPAARSPWFIRTRGAWYCPACLDEQDGRWPLAWSVPWVFACTRHHVLLAATCPGCGKPPYAGGASAAGLNPAGSCPQPAANGRCCGTDLRTAPASPLPAGHPLLDGQRQINALLATPQAAGGAVLTDLAVITRWLTGISGEHDYDQFGPAAAAAWHAYREHDCTVPGNAGRGPPASAALAGALASRAVAFLAGGDAAIAQLRQLTAGQPARRRSRQLRPPGLAAVHWDRLSAQARNRFLRALDPALATIDRIRLQTPVILAREPGTDTAIITARARRIPQLLWPAWSLRLMPPRGCHPRLFRSTIAACLLLPGNPSRDLAAVLEVLHPHRPPAAIRALLAHLTRLGNDSVLAAICHLAAYLDHDGSLIDYQRRRDLIIPAILTAGQWRDMCDRAGAHPGDSDHRHGPVIRHVHAQRYLSELLTGTDLDDPRHPLAWHDAGDRARYRIFTSTMTTPLRRALHDHAAQALRDLGIDEPAVWEPPPSCCAGLTLPGPEPGDLDMGALRQLLIEEQLSPGAAAGRLGATIGHVRLAAEHITRPAPQWSPRGRTNPLALQRQKQASSLLTREFFEREYLQHGKNLNVIAAETGFSRTILAAAARRAGITLRTARVPLRVDAGWLREQYQQRKRPVASIAAELGTSDETIRRRLHQDGITVRRPGVHSRHGILTTPAGLPPVIQRAVEGSLHGWLRLQRFQAAMQHHAIGQAAAALGIHTSSLISQFSRLERDAGHQLYHRGTPGTPMRPTQAGTELLDALRHDGVAALMNQHAKAPASPRWPRPARYGPRKPTPAERKLAFYSTLTIRRIVITPQVCAILHVLVRATASDPQGIDIGEACARCQLSRNTIYPILTRLTSARWVSRRPENPQSRRDRAGSGKGGPPYMRYDLTTDGLAAAVLELAARAAAGASSSGVFPGDGLGRLPECSVEESSDRRL